VFSLQILCPSPFFEAVLHFAGPERAFQRFMYTVYVLTRSGSSQQLLVALGTTTRLPARESSEGELCKHPPGVRDTEFA